MKKSFSILLIALLALLAGCQFALERPDDVITDGKNQKGSFTVTVGLSPDHDYADNGAKTVTPNSFIRPSSYEIKLTGSDGTPHTQNTDTGTATFPDIPFGELTVEVTGKINGNKAYWGTKTQTFSITESSVAVTVSPVTDDPDLNGSIRLAMDWNAPATRPNNPVKVDRVELRSVVDGTEKPIASFDVTENTYEATVKLPSQMGCAFIPYFYYQNKVVGKGNLDTINVYAEQTSVTDAPSLYIYNDRHFTVSDGVIDLALAQTSTDGQLKATWKNPVLNEDLNLLRAYKDVTITLTGNTEPEDVHTKTLAYTGDPEGSFIFEGLKSNTEYTASAVVTYTHLSPSPASYSGTVRTPITLESVTFSGVPEKNTAIVGDKFQLSAVAAPTGARAIGTWTSSNPDLLEVDQNGKVTVHEIGGAALEAGIADSATISFNATNADVTGNVTITVEPAGSIDEIKITPNADALEISWTATDTLRFFDVYKTVDGSETKIAEMIQAATYSDSDVQPGKKYSYRVVGFRTEAATFPVESASAEYTIAKPGVDVEFKDPEIINGTLEIKGNDEFVYNDTTTYTTEAYSNAVNYSWMFNNQIIKSGADATSVDISKETAGFTLETIYHDLMLTVTTADGSYSTTKNLTLVFPKVAFDNAPASVSIQDKVQLAAVNTPLYAQNSTMTYSLLPNDGLAEITPEGALSAHHAGNVTVVVQNAYGNKAQTEIQIVPPTLSIDQQTGTFTQLDDTTFTATSNMTTAKFVWKSSDPSIADIDANTGKLTVKDNGPVTISVTIEGVAERDARAELQINAKVAIESITLNPKTTDIMLTNGTDRYKMQQTGYTVTPSNAYVADLTPNYASTNASAIAVDQSGKITAAAPGTADITVSLGNITSTPVSYEAATVQVVDKDNNVIEGENRVSIANWGGTNTLKAQLQTADGTRQLPSDFTVSWSFKDGGQGGGITYVAFTTSGADEGQINSSTSNPTTLFRRGGSANKPNVHLEISDASGLASHTVHKTNT